MVTKTLEQTKALQVVQDFFAEFKHWIKPSAKAPNIQEVEKYLNKDVQMSNNGIMLIKSSADYVNRIQKFQKRYSRFEISEPLEPPLISDNKLAIYYRLNLTEHNGEQKQVYLFGLVTIEHNKISRWIQVTSEKGSETWDR